MNTNKPRIPPTKPNGTRDTPAQFLAAIGVGMLVLYVFLKAMEALLT